MLLVTRSDSDAARSGLDKKPAVVREQLPRAPLSPVLRFCLRGPAAYRVRGLGRGCTRVPGARVCHRGRQHILPPDAAGFGAVDLALRQLSLEPAAHMPLAAHWPRACASPAWRPSALATRT
jgi:hypothetical protein